MADKTYSPESEEKIRALYAEFFGREPDEGGLAYFAGLLDQGADISDVIAGMASNEEAINAGVQSLGSLEFGTPEDRAFYESFDVNKDKYLSPSERRRFAEATGQQFISGPGNFATPQDRDFLASFDTDKSGYLNRDERIAFENAQRGQDLSKLSYAKPEDKTYYESFDVNKDGYLSSSERTAFENAQRGQDLSKLSYAKPEDKTYYESFDVNKDGYLSSSERTAFENAQKTSTVGGTTGGAFKGTGEEAMRGDRVGKGVAVTGENSGLRDPYVDYAQTMLQRASAEADVPFQEYTKTPELITQATSGLKNLMTPGQFTAGSNLAQAAGLGALTYGNYQPTQYATGTFSNPFVRQSYEDQRQETIQDLYQNVLGRAPEKGSVEYWRDTNKTPTNQLSQQFLTSPEAQQRLAGMGYTYQAPGKAEGGTVKYQTGGDVNVGTNSSQQSPYTNNMNYGMSNLQPMVYGGQNVTNVQASYMDPYMQNVTNIAKREAQRASDIAGQREAAQAVSQGAFGGSRYGLVEAERQRNLGQQLSDLDLKGLQAAYTSGMGQFNTEQERALKAQELGEKSRQFGADLGLRGLQTSIQAGTALGNLGAQQNTADLARLKQQYDIGAGERAFDYNEFLRSEKYPYENLTFMKNMLSGLPTSAAPTGVDPLSQALSGGLSTAALIDLLTKATSTK